MEKAEAVAALAALAQETRLDVFRLLVQAGEAGVPAGRIGEWLDLPAATLSFHLTALRHAGLVTFRRDGRSLIYAAEYEAMAALLGFLTENCCQGGAPCLPQPRCEMPARRRPVPPPASSGGAAPAARRRMA